MQKGTQFFLIDYETYGAKEKILLPEILYEIRQLYMCYFWDILVYQYSLLVIELRCMIFFTYIAQQYLPSSFLAPLRQKFAKDHIIDQPFLHFTK